MKLYIDATNNLKSVVRLDGMELVEKHDTPQQQDVMATIVKILGQTGKEFKDITAIEVNTGPGSFTGTRVGVAIANALAFTLKIPVNGRMGSVAPEYDQEPNITKGKKK